MNSACSYGRNIMFAHNATSDLQVWTGRTSDRRYADLSSLHVRLQHQEPRGVPQLAHGAPREQAFLVQRGQLLRQDHERQPESNRDLLVGDKVSSKNEGQQKKFFSNCFPFFTRFSQYFQFLPKLSRMFQKSLHQLFHSIFLDFLNA